MTALMNLTELKKGYIKSQNAKRQKVRKSFLFHKKTNKVFLRCNSGEKNKMLVKAIENAFKLYKQENLFLQGL